MRFVRKLSTNENVSKNATNVIDHLRKFIKNHLNDCILIVIILALCYLESI